jgi:hypothetical protein
MPQSWDMGQIILLPLRRKGSNPRTREPEASMLTTRPPEAVSGGNSEERHISPTGDEPRLSNPHPVPLIYLSNLVDSIFTLLIIYKNRTIAKEVLN